MAVKKRETEIIKPQPGFQREFLRSPADVVIGGGSAGVGKSYALLMEVLRHHKEKRWTSVIFRRTTTQIRAAEGLWDKSEELFSRLPRSSRPKPNESRLIWKFPHKSKLQFSHLQYEKDKYNWQGAEIGLLGFDELTHFTFTQFSYMLSRNRSTTGVRPYIRATTNPQGRGWVKDLIQFFIYPDDYDVISLRGLPRYERCGQLRYFTRFKRRVVEAATPEGVLMQLPADVAAEYEVENIKSFTYIPGTLKDNPILTNLDPGYKSNLLALDEQEQEQLLHGRWCFIDDDPFRIFEYDAINDLFENTFVPFGKTAITADIAHEGSDYFIIAVWHGLRLTHLYKFEKSMGDTVIEQIRRIAKKHHVPASRIVIDTGGIGDYLKGFFKKSFHFEGHRKPMEIKDKPQNYKNLRSQCYHWLSLLVNDYQMQVDVDDATVLENLPDELWETRRKERPDKMIQIISKNIIKAELGRSPDLGDVLMMRAALYLKEVYGRRGKRSSTSR